MSTVPGHKRNDHTKSVDHDGYTDAYLRDILCATKRIAMIGASAKTNRPSYFVMKYMRGKGFHMMPVNPGYAGREIVGALVYASLEECEAPVEMVDVFRNSDAAGQITRDSIRLKDALGIKVVWMQLGVRNDVAAAQAEAAGLRVVMNRCPKIEYGRLCGESGWMGLNPRMVSSKRPKLAPGSLQNHILGDGKRT